MVADKSAVCLTRGIQMRMSNLSASTEAKRISRVNMSACIEANRSKLNPLCASIQADKPFLIVTELKGAASS